MIYKNNFKKNANGSGMKRHDFLAMAGSVAVLGFTRKLFFYVDRMFVVVHLVLLYCLSV